MAKITNIKSRQVFDSRGNPTIESEVSLNDGLMAVAIGEAAELSIKENRVVFMKEFKL